MKYVIHCKDSWIFDHNILDHVNVYRKKIKRVTQFPSYAIVEDAEGSDLYYKIKYNLNMFPLSDEQYACIIRDGVVFIGKDQLSKLSLIIPKVPYYDR